MVCDGRRLTVNRLSKEPDTDGRKVMLGGGECNKPSELRGRKGFSKGELARFEGALERSMVEN